jgi:hypothetical protein
MNTVMPLIRSRCQNPNRTPVRDHHLGITHDYILISVKRNETSRQLHSLYSEAHTTELAIDTLEETGKQKRMGDIMGIKMRDKVRKAAH